MTERYLKVEGYTELLRDTDSGAIINKNTTAYLKARSRSFEVQKRNDELRNATREINNLKCEMHEIKSLLKELVNKNGD
jgi:hypothetical protein|tara:strand:- start:958 stop:1194 length:237 start_codon:yes stop_codon:yes gene_type:complete